MHKAYSALHVKQVSEEGGVVRIKGIASTPRSDRDGDVVNPLGARFKTPMPLLMQHRHDQPVGHVTFAKPNKNGIPFEAELPRIKEEGRLKDRVDEAIHSLQYKLIGFVSVGFSPDPEKTKRLAGGGYQFDEWDWHELSIVTIPAQPDAVIASVKSLGDDDPAEELSPGLIAFMQSIDPGKLAASGKKASPVVRVTPAGASAIHTTSLQDPKPQEGKDMNIAEQIKGFEATRQAKAARMGEVMEKAAEEGRSLDAAEAEEFETLEGEVKAVDEQLKRLSTMEALNIQKAAPVVDQSKMRDRVPATAKVTEKLDKGIEFARFVMCLGAAKGDLHTAKSIALARFPNSDRINLTLKAAVEAGTTTDATWALPLVEYNQFAGDFVEFLRPQTIIGKFGQGGIPALRSIPFNVHVRGQTSGGSGYWVGQGAPKPLTAFDFNDAYLGYAKVANIAVLTQELMRFSNPSAEALVRDSLAGALIERLDTDFIDPDKAEVSNVSPASITNGVTVIVASGTGDADDIRVDVKAAMTKFIAANITPAAGVWIMSARRALSLSLMRNALGQKEFPEITMLGGTFEGLPVIVSEYVPATSGGDYVVLVNASDVWLADDGNVVVDASREASLQMLDNPTNNSASGTATSMVSMFQTNSVAIRAERWINWKKRRAAAVAVISEVNWGDA